MQTGTQRVHQKQVLWYRDGKGMLVTRESTGKVKCRSCKKGPSLGIMYIFWTEEKLREAIQAKKTRNLHQDLRIIVCYSHIIMVSWYLKYVLRFEGFTRDCAEAM